MAHSGGHASDLDQPPSAAAESPRRRGQHPAGPARAAPRRARAPRRAPERRPDSPAAKSEVPSAPAGPTVWSRTLLSGPAHRSASPGNTDRPPDRRRTPGRRPTGSNPKLEHVWPGLRRPGIQGRPARRPGMPSAAAPGISRRSRRESLDRAASSEAQTPAQHGERGEAQSRLARRGPGRKADDRAPRAARSATAGPDREEQITEAGQAFSMAAGRR